MYCMKQFCLAATLLMLAGEPMVAEEWTQTSITIRDLAGVENDRFAAEIIEALEKACPSDVGGIRSELTVSPEGKGVQLELAARADNDKSGKWVCYATFESTRDDPALKELTTKWPDSIEVLGVLPATDAGVSVAVVVERVKAAVLDGAQRVPNMPGVFLIGGSKDSVVGRDVFGQQLVDMSVRESETEVLGTRNSHAGPMCLQFPSGKIVAYHGNSNGHVNSPNIGWSEYVVSEDGGRTWSKSKPFEFTYERFESEQYTYMEEGFVAKDGTVVVIPSHNYDHFLLRSDDDGKTWQEPVLLNDLLQPQHRSCQLHATATSLDGNTQYLLIDTARGGKRGQHAMYSTDDGGRSWSLVGSDLPLHADMGYGALAVMPDGNILAAASDDRNAEGQSKFNYAILNAKTQTWSEAKSTPLAKKVRDPELSYFGGRYFLQGRSGDKGDRSVDLDLNKFVLYQSDDGINWNEGVFISNDNVYHDGYSYNATIKKAFATPENPDGIGPALMIEYSIIYTKPNTSEYCFYVAMEEDVKLPR